MSTNLSGVTTVAGWYPDPADRQAERFWDGQGWTGHARPAGVPTTVSPSPVENSASRNGFSVAAMILGALAMLFLPPLFGTVGLVLGGVAKSKGEPLANRALVVAGTGLVLGMILGVLIFLASA